MKHIYFINGTMGVGKTAVSKKVAEKLPNSVFLDGDWCWSSYPFQVNEETKKMVIVNICFLLNQFIKCSSYDNIIFCWVMHEQKIIDDILNNINLNNCSLKIISLICNEENLKVRLNKDIEDGIRNKEIIEKSINRISLYEKLNTIKIDTNDKTIENIALEIINL